ncbi:hypothetical protein H0W91_02885 [Patescibacteria group bacterium]|nr:hypothetical protein [Patescibacteria group bacterium]
MQTITGETVARGDRLQQVVQIGLGRLILDVVVQALDEVHGGAILGRDLDGPPQKNFDGSPRLYNTTKFMKVQN